MVRIHSVKVPLAARRIVKHSTRLLTTVNRRQTSNSFFVADLREEKDSSVAASTNHRGKIIRTIRSVMIMKMENEK